MLSPEHVSPPHFGEARATLDEIVKTTPAHIGITQELGRDPVYVIPIHQSPDRFKTIQTTVRSIVAQQKRNDVVPTAEILADNGVAECDMRGVISHMENSGIDVHVVSAQPRIPSEKNAAYARNQALKYLGSVREQPRARPPRRSLRVGLDNAVCSRYGWRKSSMHRRRKTGLSAHRSIGRGRDSVCL